LFAVETKAPVAVAGLIAVPLFIAALLASSLAIDRPHIVAGREHPPTDATEAKIWLAALIAPAIVLAAGLAGLALKRNGVYLTAVTAIAVCILMPHVSHGWIARHTRRFPLGIDLIKDNDPSNLSSRGEWEHAAQETIASIAHWTLGLAIGAIVVSVLLEVRRRTGRDAIVSEPAPAAITGEGEVSPVVGPSVGGSRLIPGLFGRRPKG
jgi:small-conductance mechanosensitive channel